jgi:hypothetical protein
MARQTGVNVNKLQGGLNRQNDSTDNHFGIIGSLPAAILALLPDVEVNKAIELNQIEDLQAKGFNESFDANNKILVHYHISEFFRLAPEAKLFFIPTTEQSLKEAVPVLIPAVRANSTIKGLGLFGFTDELMTLNIDKIQADLVDEFTKENRDIDFVLVEGKPKTGETFVINDLPNLRENKGTNISVLLSQDPAIARLESEYADHVSIGSALGMLAVRFLSENLGSVNIELKPRSKRALADYPLTDSVAGRWLDANLSDRTPVGEISKIDLKNLINKGYILAAGYEGYAGIFFTGSSTAVEKASDYSTIENNRVWNAGKRAIRQALLPHVKGKVKKDPQTGFIATTILAQWQGDCNKALEKMESAGHISGFEVTIDSNQIVNDETPVKVRALMVANGIVHEFDVDLGLTNNI